MVFCFSLCQESPKMHRARLRTATVVGHGSSGAAGGMSVRQQKRVLEEIKQYMYQVIIKRLCLLNVIP